MPVKLPQAHWDPTPPRPPRIVVWLCLLLVMLAANAAWTFQVWPKGEPAHTVAFWMRLVGYPLLAWVIGFGLRSVYYYQERSRLQANELVLQCDRAQAIEFAREPLALLQMGYRCVFGADKAAQKIAQGERPLMSRQGWMEEGKAAASVRHTALALDGLTQMERIESCFNALLQDLLPALVELPRRVPLSVVLQLPVSASHEALLSLWTRCWDGAGLPETKVELLAADQGVMALDAWLDHVGGAQLERFCLYVAVQVDKAPEADRAEAAAALLLAWPPLARRKKLSVRALLHRPVRNAQEDACQALGQALMWGDMAAGEVEHLWLSGCTAGDRRRLMQACSDLSMPLLHEEHARGMHDVDVAIGHAEAAAPWLGMALAAEHAEQTGRGQIVACRQADLFLMVVRPDSMNPGNGKNESSRA